MGPGTGRRCPIDSVRLTHIEIAPLAATVGERLPTSAKGATAMKSHAIHYVALDVHQATTVASVRDERGRVVMRATIPTEARALLDLVRGFGGRVEVAFEEGTQAQWLHDLLTPHAARVVVCNIRGRGEKENK